MNYPLYGLPAIESPVDQGDIIEGCPILSVQDYDLSDLESPSVRSVLVRIIVLTQTCDLANNKISYVTGALAWDAETLVAEGRLKAVDVRGPVRAGRVFGWYFLPKDGPLALPEMLVDLRSLHTIRLDLLTALCQRGQRRARVQPLYREHLAKHFADTCSRIGLPEPYPTD
jgi:hypothetical protein